MKGHVCCLSAAVCFPLQIPHIPPIILTSQATTLNFIIISEMRFFSLEPMESLVVGETMTDEVSASDAASSLMNQLTPTAAALLEKLQTLGVCALVLGTAFCICANLLTLFLLLRCRPVQRSSRTTNLYVLSLCLADLGVGCVAMPLALLNGWW